MSFHLLPDVRLFNQLCDQHEPQLRTFPEPQAIQILETATVSHIKARLPSDPEAHELHFLRLYLAMLYRQRLSQPVTIWDKDFYNFDFTQSTIGLQESIDALESTINYSQQDAPQFDGFDFVPGPVEVPELASEPEPYLPDNFRFDMRSIDSPGADSDNDSGFASDRHELSDSMSTGSPVQVGIVLAATFLSH